MDEYRDAASKSPRADRQCPAALGPQDEALLQVFALRLNAIPLCCPNSAPTQSIVLFLAPGSGQA